MGLTPAQIAARKGKLTASRVSALMSGDPVKVDNLYRLMTGDPSYVEPDLSGVWPVQLGSVTEELNLNWYERKTSHPVIRRGEVVVMPDHGWAAATLDGWDSVAACCVECKHVGGREPRERIIARYTPQCVWQMIVTVTRECALSIIEAANEPVIEWIDYDTDYARTLWERATEFMQCVFTQTPPVTHLAVDTPAPPATRVIDMQGNNRWAVSAAGWLMTRDAANDNEMAEKDLKSMVPDDAQRVFGYGVEITRDRARRLKLKAA